MPPQEEARIKADLLLAYADGKLQYNDGGHWVDWEGSAPCFIMSLRYYRRKPEQKLRPWKWDEVPVGGVVRYTDSTTGKKITTLITSMYHESISLFKENTSGVRISPDSHDFVPIAAMVDGRYEWKWPHEPGSAWRKCGVYE